MRRMPMKIFAASCSAILASSVSAAGTVYFPPAFAKASVRCERGAQEIVSDLENRWYSSHLSAAKEPSLYVALTRRKGTISSQLRFTWLRSFHPPVVVRIDRTGTNSPVLVAKQLSGAGGYAPGTISKSLERPLSATEANRLHAILMRTDISHAAPKECDRGIDGAQWLIEVMDSSGCHFVDRWSPDRGAVRELGLFLLGLTGWTFKDIY
jgi:hypothetical protein